MQVVIGTVVNMLAKGAGTRVPVPPAVLAAPVEVFDEPDRGQDNTGCEQLKKSRRYA